MAVVQYVPSPFIVLKLPVLNIRIQAHSILYKLRTRFRRFTFFLLWRATILATILQMHGNLPRPCPRCSAWFCRSKSPIVLATSHFPAFRRFQGSLLKYLSPAEDLPNPLNLTPDSLVLLYPKISRSYIRRHGKLPLG